MGNEDINKKNEDMTIKVSAIIAFGFGVVVGMVVILSSGACHG